MAKGVATIRIPHRSPTTQVVRVTEHSRRLLTCHSSHQQEKHREVQREAIDNELGLSTTTKANVASRTPSHAYTLPFRGEKRVERSEGRKVNQNRRGDNQICMLKKTTPPLMMDAPITNYHATSVRTNHNIYHAPAIPLESYKQCSHHSSFRQTDNRSSPTASHQCVPPRTKSIHRPPSNFFFPRVSSLLSSRAIGV